MTTINLGRVVGQDGANGEDGRGITSITKTGTSGLIDTYTITYTDETTSTFEVTNGADGTDGEDGKGIVSITKTATAGLVDTYTILYTDGTTSTFEVTNGSGGGGTSDYTDLENKPSINSVTLSGNKTSSDLGVQDTLVSGTNIKTINNTSLLGSGDITISGGGQTLEFNNGIEKHGDKVMLPSTDDVAFAIADANGNSVFVVENNGDIDFQLSEALKTKIRSIDDYEFDADVYMVPCVGQSLAVNTDAGPSTFSSTYPLSYNTSLVNTNLQDMNTGFCEAFNLAADYYNVHIPGNFKIITCVVGSGGKSINVFGKGTTYYNQVISNITTAYNACKNAGLRMVVPGFMWTQGEEDMRCGGTKENYGSGQWDPFQYHTKLRSMIDSFNTDIKAITGQDMDVHCFSYQLTVQTAYRRYPRIALEQEKLAEMDDRMLVSKIMYDINYNNDQVHAPAGSYRNMGNMYGLACFKKCVLKENYKWTHPINFDLDGNVLYIDFEVPTKPLDLDTTLITQLDDNNYGFNIYDVSSETATSQTIQYITEATTRITKVELVGNSKVKITMSRTPVTGERLTYGVNGTGWQCIGGYALESYPDRASGHVSGPRGCLRDSNGIKNNNSGVTIPDLYNWCPIFEHVF